MGNDSELKNSKRKTLLQRTWKWIKKVFIWLFIVQFLYIILLKWVNPPITMTQVWSWVQGYGLERDYVNRHSISPEMKLAVIASEDQLFPDHHGFDWKSIEKARRYNEKKPGRIRGASTISQQVAKNVFLWQSRSWVRKALEVYFTFMIELLWGKKRILEVYLNVIEMGKGVFGVEMAAKFFFNKSGATLTRQDAARIASCLPNPKKYERFLKGPYITIRARNIMRQMTNLETDPDIRRVIEPGQIK